MDIHEACNYVVQKSMHVRTDRENYGAFGEIIDTYRGKLDIGAFGKFKFEGKKKRMRAKVLLNALNFNFWEKKDGKVLRYEVERKGKKHYGAGALFESIDRSLGSGFPLLEPYYLARASESDVDKIFRGNIRIPMVDKRAIIMQELGRSGEQLDSFISRAGSDYWKLVDELVRTYPSFNDTWKYGEVDVPFYKRAQLLVSSLHVQGDLKVSGTENGTAFADYRVPQALRELGIIKYSKQLASDVDNLVDIKAGSAAEVEIRAASLVSCNRLAKEYGLKVVEVDNILWMHGRQCKGPHHLTKTTSY